TFIATDREMPARSRCLTAERLKSWSRSPGQRGLYTTYAPPSPTRGDRHGPSVGGDALHAEVATSPVSSMPREQLRRNLSTQCRTGVSAATTHPSKSKHSTPAGHRSL